VARAWGRGPCAGRLAQPNGRLQPVQPCTEGFGRPARLLQAVRGRLVPLHALQRFVAPGAVLRRAAAAVAGRVVRRQRLGRAREQAGGGGRVGARAARQRRAARRLRQPRCAVEDLRTRRGGYMLPVGRRSRPALATTRPGTASQLVNWTQHLSSHSKAHRCSVHTALMPGKRTNACASMPPLSLPHDSSTGRPATDATEPGAACRAPRRVHRPHASGRQASTHGNRHELRAIQSTETGRAWSCWALPSFAFFALQQKNK